MLRNLGFLTIEQDILKIISLKLSYKIFLYLARVATFMLIKAVRLHNIRSYVHQRVEFPLGSTLLAGDVGSGKSTILLAIEFALFGILRGTLEGSTLLRYGVDSGSVEVELEIDEKNIILKRTLKRGKNGITQEHGFIIIDGVKTEGTHTEIKARVLELLGYPRELGRSKDLIYRFTVYTPQEDMKRILSEDKEIRLETLRKVFQIDKYKRVTENAEVVLRELKNLRKENLIRCESLEEETERKKELEKKIDEIKKQIMELDVEIKSVTEKEEHLGKNLQEIESEMCIMQELKARHGSVMATLQEKNRLTNALKKEFAITQEGMKNKKKKLELGDDVKKRIYELDEKIKHKEKIKEHIKELEHSMQDIQRTISQHEILVREANKRKNMIETLDKCPTCEQIVSREYKQGISIRQESTINELKSHAGSLEANKKRNEVQLKEIKSQLDEIIESERILARLTAEDKLIDEIAKEILALEERVKINNEQIENLIAENEKLTMERAEIDIKLKDFEETASRQKDLKEKMETILVREKELLVKRAMLTKEDESLKAMIDIINADVEEMEKNKEQASMLLEKISWIMNYFIPVMDLIERNVMLKTHSQFNQYFRNWFSVLMEEETITARIDEEFTPVIEQNGYEVSIENLSGGEKTSCALAYRLALAKVVNDIVSPIRTQDLIILDEPTDGFSSEQLDRIKDVLDQLNFKQVIIVSHESKIESFVDNIVRLKKSENKTELYTGAVVYPHGNTSIPSLNSGL
jgi:exonuclease SbcC